MNKFHYRSILKDIYWIVGSFIIHRDPFLFIPSNRGRGLLYRLLFFPQLSTHENKNKSSTPTNIVRFGLSEIVESSLNLLAGCFQYASGAPKI